MLLALLLLAEAEAQQQQAPPGNLLMTLFPFLLIGIIFYFLMIRPMKRQEAERQNLLSRLKKNDKVVTSGGIIGVIANVNEKEDEVTLKVDDNSNVRLRVTRSSIVRVIEPSVPVTEQK